MSYTIDNESLQLISISIDENKFQKVGMSIKKQ
jgi:hypothetical protein